MVMAGLDRLPEYLPPAEFAGRIDDDQLVLLSGAAHHYVSSSLANLAVLMRKEGEARGGTWLVRPAWRVQVRDLAAHEAFRLVSSISRGDP